MFSFRMYDQFSKGIYNLFYLQFIQRDLPIYIPITSVGELQLLYIHMNMFFSVFLILVILVVV